MFPKEKRQSLLAEAQNEESLANNKNIIVAVLLNLLLSGLGHVYLGFYWIGAIFLFSIIALSFYHYIILVLPLSMILGNNTIQQIDFFTVDLTIQAIIFTITTFDIILRFKYYEKRKEHQETFNKNKSAFKALILNLICPGVGLYYSGLKKSAMVFFLIFQIINTIIQKILFDYWNTFPQDTTWHYFASLFATYILQGVVISLISIVYIRTKKSKALSLKNSKNIQKEKNHIEKSTPAQIPTAFYKPLSTIVKYLLMAGIIIGSIIAAFILNQTTLNFQNYMIGVFIVLVLIKSFIQNIEIIQGNLKDKKFDVSIIFNFVILFTMGFRYAVLLIILGNLTSIIIKKIYSRNERLDLVKVYEDTAKNLFALSFAFLIVLTLNPNQIYSFDAPQNMFLPTIGYLVCLLLTDYKPKRVFSTVELIFSYLIFFMTVIVFSTLFYISIVHGKFTGLYLITFAFLVIQFLIEIQHEYFTNKIKIMEMEIKVFKDELTDAYNKRYLSNIIEDLNNNMEEYSLIMLDIDNFKKINDTYGHQVGDTVLRHVVNIAKGCTRKESDIVCRYGGEEFVIISKGVSKETAANLAERIRNQLEKTPFILSNKQALHITASFGVADWGDGKDIIKVADESLYKAKNSGKNKVVISEIVA